MQSVHCCGASAAECSSPYKRAACKHVQVGTSLQSRKGYPAVRSLWLRSVETAAFSYRPIVRALSDLSMRYPLQLCMTRATPLNLRNRSSFARRSSDVTAATSRSFALRSGAKRLEPQWRPSYKPLAGTHLYDLGTRHAQTAVSGQSLVLMNVFCVEKSSRVKPVPSSTELWVCVVLQWSA